MGAPVQWHPWTRTGRTYNTEYRSSLLLLPCYVYVRYLHRARALRLDRLYVEFLRRLFSANSPVPPMIFRESRTVTPQVCNRPGAWSWTSPTSATLHIDYCLLRALGCSPRSRVRECISRLNGRIVDYLCGTSSFLLVRDESGAERAEIGTS